MGSVKKIYLLSIPIALWWLISEDFGWFYGVLMIVPVTVFIGLLLAAILEWLIEPLVRWIKK
jgi:hypothetical protein